MGSGRSSEAQSGKAGIARAALVAASAVTFASAGCTASDPAAPEAHEPAHWGYSGDHGPEHWGELSEAFAACRDGRSQSPIDIVDTIDLELPAITLAHDGSTVAVQNNGHTLQIDVGPGSTLEVGEQTFVLEQFHVHSPSEHQIEGEQFALEVHFVHVNDRGEIVVLSVLFREGPWNSGLEKVGRKAPMKIGETIPISIPLAELDIVPEERAYYRYEGSLTTPPCTEGLRWLILESSDTIARAQVERYIELIGEDARGPQPLNGRQVFR